MKLLVDKEILSAGVFDFKASRFMRQITGNVLGKQEIDGVTSNIQNRKHH